MLNILTTYQQFMPEVEAKESLREQEPELDDGYNEEEYNEEEYNEEEYSEEEYSEEEYPDEDDAGDENGDYNETYDDNF
ncbi:hypothetical protein [Mannheimia haemolytica]|uniref:hypothetical protein n=1 Tax=Mannheimia haemolytica TaxID=75985 RepID=UPI001FD709C9|nr:hypothetical protein [Mannheimia haemolytica]